ncbi:alpha/beta fold hydrolase [Faunimonas sp. B44]|uniref:alpha/beta fold hydrolase n=1 Tax=Faunimonas sp. B44 TaxID=3461493 RepID=UPI004044ACA8
MRAFLELGITGRTAALPGVDLWYSDSLAGDVPVVLIHANTGTSASWAPQIAVLADAGFRVIAFDRRGWGKSVPNPSGVQPGTIADDLDALADHLGLAAFHLVAVAGGGFGALDYAAWRPERVRSLVAAATTGNVHETAVRAFIERIEVPGLREQPAVYREVGPSYRGSDPEGTRRWIETCRAARQPGAQAQPVRTPNTFAKLASIKAPTLVVAGGADLIAPPALVRMWAKHISGHEWALLPESGHSVATEAATEFNAVLLAFLNRH